MTKLPWTGSFITLSDGKTALVIWDDGLPVLSNHSFIRLILCSGPSISPFTVSSLVFIHQPVRLSESACFFVYFRKNTPCTRPNTSNSHKYRGISTLTLTHSFLFQLEISLFWDIFTVDNRIVWFATKFFAHSAIQFETECHCQEVPDYSCILDFNNSTVYYIHSIIVLCQCMSISARVFEHNFVLGKNKHFSIHFTLLLFIK